MKPGGARNKGHDAEREVIKILTEACGKQVELHRNLLQTRQGGYDIVGLEWLAIEVKRQETLDVENWWKQTLKQADDNQVPVLIYRQNRKAWNIVMMGQVGNTLCRVTINMLAFTFWLQDELRARGAPAIASPSRTDETPVSHGLLTVTPQLPIIQAQTPR